MTSYNGRGSAPCCLGGLGGPQWGLLQISIPYDSLMTSANRKCLTMVFCISNKS